MGTGFTRTVSELLEALCERPPDREVILRIVDAMAGELDCERVFLFRFRSQGGFHVLAARSRDREDIDDPQRRMSHYVISRMVRSRAMVFVKDARRDRRFRPEAALDGKRAPRSIVAFPLHVGETLFGGLYADHRFQPLVLEEQRLERVRGLASILSLALRQRQLVREARSIRRGRPSGTAARRPANAAGSSVTTALLDPEAGSVAESFHGFLSANPDMKDIFDTIRSLVGSDLPVLISGPTGTGKGLLASAVHRSSHRSDRPFFSLHPSAVPESLIEAELLGHVRGAFTGADADRDGAFVLADGGTLFFDEIADMSEAFQKNLLRVLEDGMVRPLGAKSAVKVDVRVIAVTREDVDRLVRRGSFRRDLYFRLKGVVLEIPPLCERREDILPLADLFLTRHAKQEGREPPLLDEGARRRLLRYDWPGNGRELENEMRRLVALGSETVEARHLAAFLRRPARSAGGGAGGEGGLQQALERVERDVVQDALRREHGNKARAARLLGITRKALYRRLEKYGLR